MLSYKIEPRFCETDALGHINHTVVPMWLEQARSPVFQLFNPSLSIVNWNLILRKICVDYISQIYLGSIVEIKTYIGEIRQTSFIVEQDVLQNGNLVAKADVILIHFDYETQSKANIPPSIRENLVKLQKSDTHGINNSLATSS